MSLITSCIMDRKCSYLIQTHRCEIYQSLTIFTVEHCLMLLTWVSTAKFPINLRANLVLDNFVT